MRPLVPEDVHRNGNRAAAQRRTSVNAVMRACAARALGALHKGRLDPVEHTRARWPDDRLAQFVVKAAASPAMHDQATWAAELSHSVVADFIAALAPASAAADLFAKGLQLGFDQAGQVRVPSFVVELGNAGFAAAG